MILTVDDIKRTLKDWNPDNLNDNKNSLIDYYSYDLFNKINQLDDFSINNLQKILQEIIFNQDESDYLNIAEILYDLEMKNRTFFKTGILSFDKKLSYDSLIIIVILITLLMVPVNITGSRIFSKLIKTGITLIIFYALYVILNTIGVYTITIHKEYLIIKKTHKTIKINFSDIDRIFYRKINGKIAGIYFYIKGGKRINTYITGLTETEQRMFLSVLSRKNKTD